mmetsp:Transcript_53691/g.126356  ORF Transcript_53691/g.126356 Transcript_53691/m.126356 type:complete len:528 (-) Transcript_53691:1334-2917(-)
MRWRRDGHALVIDLEHLRRDRRTRDGTQQAVDDDQFARLDAVDDAHAVDQRTRRDRAWLHDVVGADDQHDLAGLIGRDGPLGHQNAAVAGTAGELDAGVQARRELAGLVVEHRAHADGCGGGVESVVDEVELAGVRKAVLVGQAHLHGHRVARDRLAFAGRRHVLQIGRLAGVEIGKHLVAGHQRRQHRLANADQVARRDVGARGAAIDRRSDVGVFDVEPRLHQGRLGRPQIGFGRAQAGTQLVDLLLADGVDADQLLGAGQFGLGQLGLGLQRGDLCLGAGDVGLEGAGVDAEQRVALLDPLALLEAHRLDGAGHAGAHFNRVGRLQPGGELLELLHLALGGGSHRHRRRAPRAAMAARTLGLLAARCEQRNQDGGQGERDVLLHAGLQGKRGTVARPLSQNEGLHGMLMTKNVNNRYTPKQSRPHGGGAACRSEGRRSPAALPATPEDPAWSGRWELPGPETLAGLSALRGRPSGRRGRAQCTPCIHFFISGFNSISTMPAPIGMAVKIRKKTDIEYSWEIASM